MICEATTDRGVKVLCSQGTDGRIGRAVTESEPNNEFHLMNYEQDMTEFIDISVTQDGVVAIDECGEIWILCGLNRYFFRNLGLKKDNKVINMPTCTNYMGKAGLRATKIRLGNQCMIVEAVDKISGKKVIKVIKDTSPDRKDH